MLLSDAGLGTEVETGFRLESGRELPSNRTGTQSAIGHRTARSKTVGGNAGGGVNSAIKLLAAARWLRSVASLRSARQHAAHNEPILITRPQDGGCDSRP